MRALPNAIAGLPPECTDWVRTRGAQLFAYAHGIQGDEAFEMTKQAAAVHEAGHAVAFQAVAGGPFSAPTEVTIWRDQHDNQSWVGRTFDSSPSVRLDTPRLLWTSAIRTLSGVISEQLVLKDDFRHGSSLDEVLRELNAILLSDVLAISEVDSMRHTIEDTRSILGANMTILRRIAERLERDRSIKGRDLKRLLSSVTVPNGLGSWLSTNRKGVSADDCVTPIWRYYGPWYWMGMNDGGPHGWFDMAEQAKAAADASTVSGPQETLLDDEDFEAMLAAFED